MKRLALRTSLAVAIMAAIVLFTTGGASISTAHAASHRHVAPASYIECSSQVWNQKASANNSNWNGYNMNMYLYAGYDSNYGNFCGDWYGKVTLYVPSYKTGGTVYSYYNADNVTYNAPSKSFYGNYSSSQSITLQSKIFSANCAYVIGNITLSTGVSEGPVSTSQVCLQ